MALNLIMLGAPGAGKGTQAGRFAVSRGIPKISTGDILRDAVQAGSPIGQRAKATMDSGKLVEDDVMIAIAKERLERDDARGGFVLDGFPRTVVQAVALDGIMSGRDPLIIIEIAVPPAELVRRLATRMICVECGATAAPGEVACQRCGGRLVQRPDDNENVVLERLKVYNTETQPLIDFYRPRPTFRTIDGAQPPDRVASELAAAIEAVAMPALPPLDAPGRVRR